MDLAKFGELLEQPVEIFLNVANQLPGPLKPYVDLAEGHLKNLVEPLLGNFDYLSLKSPHTEILPLMNPYHVIMIILGYFFVIGFTRIFMTCLPPLPIKYFTMLHNVFLLSLSAYMMTGILFQAYTHDYKFWGNNYDGTEKGVPMAKMIWLFYVSKIIEFIDTLIMALKKNYRQISFLHVYHHFTIFAIWWLVTFMAPGGEAYYSAALNSFIHVVMYGYYFLASLGVSQVSFIKRYITMMQMTQFVTMMAQAAFDIYTGGGGYPALLSKILFFYMITLLILFANFFVKDRQRAARERKEKSATSTPKSKNSKGRKED